MYGVGKEEHNLPPFLLPIPYSDTILRRDKLDDP